MMMMGEGSRSPGLAMAFVIFIVIGNDMIFNLRVINNVFFYCVPFFVFANFACRIILRNDD